MNRTALFFLTLSMIHVSTTYAAPTDTLLRVIDKRTKDIYRVDRNIQRQVYSIVAKCNNILKHAPITMTREQLHLGIKHCNKRGWIKAIHINPITRRWTFECGERR